MNIEYGQSAINVIRMIKLFGWEPRVADRLKSRREDELMSIRKYKMLELLNNTIKYVSTSFPVMRAIEMDLPATLFLSPPWSGRFLHTCVLSSWNIEDEQCDNSM